jgi:hypothetical protein
MEAMKNENSASTSRSNTKGKVPSKAKQTPLEADPKEKLCLR